MRTKFAANHTTKITYEISYARTHKINVTNDKSRKKLHNEVKTQLEHTLLKSAIVEIGTQP